MSQFPILQRPTLRLVRLPRRVPVLRAPAFPVRLRPAQLINPPTGKKTRLQPTGPGKTAEPRP